MIRKSNSKLSINQLLLIITSASGYLFSIWRTGSLLLQDLTRSNAEEFSSIIVSFIENCGALLLCSLVFAAFFLEKIKKRGVLKKDRSVKTKDDRLFKLSLGFFIVILASSVVSIVVVNPRGLYGFSLFPQLYDNIRQEKVGYYLDLTETPEVIIIGTSRTLSLSPDYIEETLGYSAFNFGISGPQLDDSLLVAKFVFDHSDLQRPEVIIFEVEGLHRINPKRTAQVSPLQFVAYMEAEMKVLAVVSRIQEIFNVHQLSEALYVLQAVQGDEALSTYWDVTPNGFTAFKPPFTLEEDIARLEETGRPKTSCKNKSESEDYIREIVDLAEKHDIAIVFYISPMHPYFFQKYFEKDSNYVQCFNDVYEFFVSLEKEHENVFFINLKNIESIDGITDETGFYDRQHLTPKNANLLIDAMAESIHQAYQKAVEEED